MFNYGIMGLAVGFIVIQGLSTVSLLRMWKHTWSCQNLAAGPRLWYMFYTLSNKENKFGSDLLFVLAVAVVASLLPLPIPLAILCVTSTTVTMLSSWLLLDGCRDWHMGLLWVNQAAEDGLSIEEIQLIITHPDFPRRGDGWENAV